MAASRRKEIEAFSGIAAMLALALASPAAAQNNDAPIDVTAAPPPSAETIGPSQLRDFNLQGTVTRPADRSTTTPAQPTTTASARPRDGEAVPAEAAAAEPNRRPATNSGSASIASTTSRPSAPASGGTPVTPSLPLEVSTNIAPQPGFTDDSVTPPPPSSDDALLSWPWLAALIALIGGGAFIAVSRRSRRQRYGDPGRLAFAGATPDSLPEPRATPPVRPRPDPVPPRAQPQPAPRPDAVPTPAPRRPDDGMIVSTRLRPELNVEFHPERVVLTDQEVILQFEIVLANVGSAPARDVLVEGRLFTAHVGQDREIAEFFQNPTVEGDRMNAIAPLGRISLKSIARLPLDAVHRFEAGGRKLFVPMIGFNILYRTGSGDGQASASFLIGRGNEEDEKLSPFRIDQGPRNFRGLTSRPHSVGLQRA